MASQIGRNVFEPYPAQPGEAGEEWLDPNGFTEVFDGKNWVRVKRSELGTMPTTQQAPQMASAQPQAGSQIGPLPPPPPMRGIGGQVGNMAGQQVGQQLGAQLLPSSGVSTAANPMSGYSATESALGMGPATSPYGVMTGPGGDAIGTMGPSAAAPVAPGMFQAGGAGLQGLGIAAGAAVGSQQIGGIANAVQGKDMSPLQQASLLGATGGAILLYNPIKNYLDKDEWKKEKNALGSLQKNGVFIPDNLLQGMPTKGRKLDSLINKDLPEDFVGQDANGNWVNNKFAKSRDVADLQATDIVNYSAFAEKDPEWFKKPMEERMSVAQQALDAKAVTEGKGTIKVDFNKLQAPVQAAQPPMGVQPGQVKDPNVRSPTMPKWANDSGTQASPAQIQALQNGAPKPPINTSTVQKPVPPKAGALSLQGWKQPGMMTNNPPSKTTILGKK